MRARHQVIMPRDQTERRCVTMDRSNLRGPGIWHGSRLEGENEQKGAGGKTKQWDKQRRLKLNLDTNDENLPLKQGTMKQ